MPTFSPQGARSRFLSPALSAHICLLQVPELPSSSTSRPADAAVEERPVPLKVGCPLNHLPDASACCFQCEVSLSRWSRLFVSVSLCKSSGRKEAPQVSSRAPRSWRAVWKIDGSFDPSERRFLDFSLSGLQVSRVGLRRCCLTPVAREGGGPRSRRGRADRGGAAGGQAGR